MIFGKVNGQKVEAQEVYGKINNHKVVINNAFTKINGKKVNVWEGREPKIIVCWGIGTNIYYSLDKGKTWQTKTFSTNVGSVSFVIDTFYIMLTNRTVYTTKDFVTFTTYNMPYSFDEIMYIKDLNIWLIHGSSISSVYYLQGNQFKTSGWVNSSLPTIEHASSISLGNMVYDNIHKKIVLGAAPWNIYLSTNGASFSLKYLSDGRHTSVGYGNGCILTIKGSQINASHPILKSTNGASSFTTIRNLFDGTSGTPYEIVFDGKEHFMFYFAGRVYLFNVSDNTLSEVILTTAANSGLVRHLSGFNGSFYFASNNTGIYKYLDGEVIKLSNITTCYNCTIDYDFINGK